MEMERAAIVLLERTRRERRVGERRVGERDETAMTCSECGAGVRRETPLPAAAPSDPRRLPKPRYACVDCGKVRAPAEIVDRELQALVRRRWNDTAWLHGRHVTAIEELTAEISESRAVYAWWRENRRARRVVRTLNARSPDPLWGLYLLGEHTVELIERRAALEHALGPEQRQDVPRLALLRLASSTFGWMYLGSRYRPSRSRMPASYNEEARELARRHGGRRKLIAATTQRQDRLWELCAERYWRDADPSMLWEETVLAEDWAASPWAWPERRHSLVTEAVGDGRVLLCPDDADEPRVRLVRSGEGDGD